MAGTNSFDVVSDVNLMEVSNAVQQAMKEIRQRFDFKGSVSDVKRVSGTFGVEFWKDEGLLIHSFGTSVIDRRGTLVGNLEGNQFTAEQLGDLVQTAMDRK